MNLILDTHILIWWLHDLTEQLSKGQRVALTEAQKRHQLLALSAITLWEIAMLRDAADQTIVATARCHRLTLITSDARIRKWGKVNLV